MDEVVKGDETLREEPGFGVMSKAQSPHPVDCTDRLGQRKRIPLLARCVYARILRRAFDQFGKVVVYAFQLL